MVCDNGIAWRDDSNSTALGAAKIRLCCRNLWVFDMFMKSLVAYNDVFNVLVGVIFCHGEQYRDIFS